MTFFFRGGQSMNDSTTQYDKRPVEIFWIFFSYNNQVFMRKMVNHIRQGEIEPFARKEDLDGETNK